VNHCAVTASQTRSQRASLCFPAGSATLSAICHPCLAPCLPFPVCRCISSGLAPVTGRAADPQIRPAALAAVLQWQTVQLSLADYRRPCTDHTTCSLARSLGCWCCCTLWGGHTRWERFEVHDWSGRSTDAYWAPFVLGGGGVYYWFSACSWSAHCC